MSEVYKLEDGTEYKKDDYLKVETKEHIHKMDCTRKEVPCKTHPDAPHGFNRNSSHSLGRYVCDCEFWEEE